jgi:hypothetical protein
MVSMDVTSSSFLAERPAMILSDHGRAYVCMHVLHTLKRQRSPSLLPPVFFPTTPTALWFPTINQNGYAAF